MLGTRQSGAELNEFALPGEGFQVDASNPDFSAGRADGNLSLAESDFEPTEVHPENSEYVQPTTPAEPPLLKIEKHSVPTNTSAATLQPRIDPLDETMPPLGQLLFPVTSMPFALDYSKAVNNSRANLLELPAVAARDDATTVEPINR
jgi:hypothetical protein